MDKRIKARTKLFANAFILIINILVTIFLNIPFNISLASSAPLLILAIMLFIAHMYSNYTGDEEINFHPVELGIAKDIKVARYHIISDITQCLLIFQIYLIFFYSDITKILLSVFASFLSFIIGNIVSYIKLNPIMKERAQRDKEELKKQQQREQMGIK